MKNKNTIIGIGSVVLGGVIYVLLRSQNLLMFSWFDSLGLKPAIVALRALTEPYSLLIPRWFYLSLPNALWAFGGIVLFYSIWKDSISERALWISVFSVIAVGSEIGQLVGVVPGTYDNNDMALMLIFLLLAIVIGGSQKIKEADDAKDL